MNHQYMGAAHGLQNLGNRSQPLLGIHPNNLALGTRRVGQRPEQVKDSPRQQFTTWADSMLHR